MVKMYCTAMIVSHHSSGPTSFQVAVTPHSVVTAVHYPARPDAIATVVLGHGAGAGQHSEFMRAVASGLAERHIHIVTFNFPFTERGTKLPDPQPVLETTFRAVLAYVARDPLLRSYPLFVGGKSLGGRIASQVVASADTGDDEVAAWWPALRGLVFLGYPLHPPGRPQQLRVSHLQHITHPMLFVQGQRDGFGTPDELRVFLDVLAARCDLVAVQHGDHSLVVPNRSGLVQADVHAKVLDAIAGWIADLGRA
jgi:predicted alpha/beta-hydrolase family hydrolase